jgi:hypothetical protein
MPDATRPYTASEKRALSVAVLLARLPGVYQVYIRPEGEEPADAEYHPMYLDEAVVGHVQVGFTRSSQVLSFRVVAKGAVGPPVDANREALGRAAYRLLSDHLPNPPAVTVSTGEESERTGTADMDFECVT